MTGTVPGAAEDEPSGLGRDLYRLIRRYPTAPLAWLGTALGVGDTRLAAEWAALTAHRWVGPGDEPDTWVAADPDQVVVAAEERERAGADAVAERRRGGWDVVWDSIGDYVDGRQRPTSTAGIEVITGEDAARARLLEVLDVCSANLALYDGATEAGTSMALPHDLAALDRGLRDVCVFEAGLLRHPWMRRYTDSLSAGGAEAHVIDVIPVTMKIFVGDRADVAVVPIAPDDLGAGCVVTHAPALVRPLRRFLDGCIAAGRPLRPTAGAPEGAAADRRRAVTRLMGEGRTDQAIATRLGVSLRTVTRDVEDLMRETGSTSRFQLGLRLGADPAPPATG